MQATELTEVLKKLDDLQSGVGTIQSDLQELKLESRVFQAQTTAKLENLGQRIDFTNERIDVTNGRIDVTNQRIESLEKTIKTETTALEIRLNAQDARIWGVVAGVVIALFGLLTKVAFFPGVKV